MATDPPDAPSPEDPDGANNRKFGPNPDAENRELLFYPQIPGDVQVRHLWYMRKRHRPMTPAPANTPMPDKQRDAEAKGRCYSTYLRPWTLDKTTASGERRGRLEPEGGYSLIAANTAQPRAPPWPQALNGRRR